MSNEHLRMIRFGPGIRARASTEEFGKKAAVLSRMAAWGIPVPPGFTLSVGICEDYFRNGEILPADVPGLLRRGLRFLEKTTGLTYGADRFPLLVSVRSGAPSSIPGAMDTILNVGLTRDTLRGLTRMSGNPRFAWDTYRRYLEAYGTLVLAQDPAAYRRIRSEVLERAGLMDESDLDFSGLREIAEQYERLHRRRRIQGSPTDPYAQLEMAVIAVIRSWNSTRARKFREIDLFPNARGTAVTIQTMIFGNLGFSSGAGVAFSRNPWTGAKEMLVDFRFRAQGEEIVSGESGTDPRQSLALRMPDVARELNGIARKLEAGFGDMQDIEFTVQEGRIFILQSRAGKRAPLAAVRIAADLVDEGRISIPDALRLLDGVDIESIIILQQVPSENNPLLARGLSASAGIVSGRVALSPEHAIEMAETSPVILVRETASPDDIAGISAAAGLLTGRGARTSHATVIARQMGKVCIVGCSHLKIDPHRRVCIFPGHEIHEGDMITLDGQEGAVYEGVLQVRSEKPVDLLFRVSRLREAGQGVPVQEDTEMLRKTSRKEGHFQDLLNEEIPGSPGEPAGEQGHRFSHEGGRIWKLQNQS